MDKNIPAKHLERIPTGNKGSIMASNLEGVGVKRTRRAG
jgi:hypothetical protein